MQCCIDRFTTGWSWVLSKVAHFRDLKAPNCDVVVWVKWLAKTGATSNYPKELKSFTDAHFQNLNAQNCDSAWSQWSVQYEIISSQNRIRNDVSKSKSLEDKLMSLFSSNCEAVLKTSFHQISVPRNGSPVSHNESHTFPHTNPTLSLPSSLLSLISYLLSLISYLFPLISYL